MENTIRETLKGLEIALEERKQKEQEIKAKDNESLVEEKRIELQKEMDEKLNAYKDQIEEEKKSEVEKVSDEIAFIEKLIAEFEEKLPVEKEEVIEEQEIVTSEDSQILKQTTAAEVQHDATKEFINKTLLIHR